MSEEEIKKISIEYADGLKKWFPNMEKHTYRDKIAQAGNVIRLIMRDFCIVPKESIRQLYAKMELDGNHIDSDNDWALYEAMDELEKIFGSELFEQKGE